MDEVAAPPRRGSATATPASPAARGQSLQRPDTEKAALGPARSPTLSVADQLELASLQNGLAELAAAARAADPAQLRNHRGSDDRFLSLSTTSPVTEPNALVNGLIGMLAGAAVAIFALIFITRGTKPVWLPEDLEIPFLGQVPARRARVRGWGGLVRHHRRRGTEAGHPGIAIGGRGPTPLDGGHACRDRSPRESCRAVHALATDLAVSMASAGSTVLLVDADFTSDAAVAEYRVGGSSLSGVLALNPESIGFERAVASAVSDSLFVRPRSGSGPARDRHLRRREMPSPGASSVASSRRPPSTSTSSWLPWETWRARPLRWRCSDCAAACWC